MNHSSSFDVWRGPVALAMALAGCPAWAQVTVDFRSNLLLKQPFYAFDGQGAGTQGDGIVGGLLSTADRDGFDADNFYSPYLLYIHGQALVGTTTLQEDLRVNFFYGATGEVSFGYALTSVSPGYGVRFTVYDVGGQALGSTVNMASLQNLPSGGQSFYPENRVTLNFTGVAAYGIFDFGVTFVPPPGCPPLPNLPPPCGPGGGGGGPASLPPSWYIFDDLTMTFAGTTKLAGFAGVIASDPVLPQTVSTGPGGVTQFDFNLLPGAGGAGVSFPIFVDPEMALGYTYTVKSGPNIAAVLIPKALAHGDASFVLEIDGVGSFALQAGIEFDLLALNPAGFKSFRIVGIDPAEALDPNDAQAFVTGLRFVGAGEVSLSQEAITSVPEPTEAWLLAVGLGLLSLRRRVGSRASGRT